MSSKSEKELRRKASAQVAADVAVAAVAANMEDVEKAVVIAVANDVAVIVGITEAA